MPEILVKTETGIDAVATAVARLASLRPEEVSRPTVDEDRNAPPARAVITEMAPHQGLLFLSIVVDGYTWSPSENIRLAADLSKFLDAPVYAWIKPDGWNDALAEFVNGTQTRVIDVEDEDD